MIYSMTGFGRAVGELSGKKITVEVRSLNSKQLDLNLRIPNRFREKEGELRKLLSIAAGRGKIDFNIHLESTGVERTQFIDKQLVAVYHAEAKALAQELGENGDLLPHIFRFPEVFKSDYQELDENEWNSILPLVEQAVDAFHAFRKEEGTSLSKELLARKNSILSLLSEVEKYEDERLQAVRSRIEKALTEAVSSENVDKNRLEQELIYYIEKLDVTEEKVRLKKHCEYFEETLNAEDDSGRKLGFICQEMGREINTLGSKANHAEIQRIVVQMKDDLEKIKEQVLNVL